MVYKQLILITPVATLPLLRPELHGVELEKCPWILPIELISRIGAISKLCCSVPSFSLSCGSTVREGIRSIVGYYYITKIIWLDVKTTLNGLSGSKIEARVNSKCRMGIVDLSLKSWTLQQQKSDFKRKFDSSQQQPPLSNFFIGQVHIPFH